MGRLHDNVRRCVREDRYLIGEHAAEQLGERGIVEWQIVSGVEHGELLAERPKTKPNPSIELLQWLADGTKFKAVWSYLTAADVAKLVTAHFFDRPTR